MPRRLALRCQSAEELGKKRRRGYQRQGESRAITMSAKSRNGSLAQD
jgi:hypothetical protein